MELWQCYQNSYFGSASLKFLRMRKLQIFNAFDNLLTNKKLDLFIFLSSGIV